MANVTNASTNIQVLRDRNGKDVEIAPGQTESIDINKDDPRTASLINAKLIKVGGSAARSAGTTTAGSGSAGSKSKRSPAPTAAAAPAAKTGE